MGKDEFSLLAGRRRFRADLNELPTESAFDAEIAVGHAVLSGGIDFDDLLVLNPQRQSAAHSAVWADGIRGGLARFVPGARLAHVVFAHKHQRTGGAYPNAISAIEQSGYKANGVSINREISRAGRIKASAIKIFQHSP